MRRRRVPAALPPACGEFLKGFLLAGLLWACPTGIFGSDGGPLSLRLTLPYAATVPGEDLVVYVVLRNRGDRPTSLPTFSVRMESEVEGRPVVLLPRPAPSVGGASFLLGPGESRAFRLAAPLDRRLFLPGSYRLSVRLVPDHGPALFAEATFTVRYTKVFFY